MTDAPERIWTFDRYVNGVLMAEGVQIERATSFAEACISAARLASRGPTGEVPVLVLTPSPEVAALIAEARREAEAMADGLVKASAWVSVAAEVLAGYNRDLGVDLPDTTEIGRIYESRDTPSFRITVGHIRILAAAIRALKETTHDLPGPSTRRRQNMSNQHLESLLDDADRIVAVDLYPARCRTVIANLAAALRSQSSDLVECREYGMGLVEELIARTVKHDQFVAMANSMHDDFVDTVEALGAMPEGYCFCSENRIGDDSKTHEPECADIRALIARRQE